LSGANDAASVAERKRLEAQLLEAKEDLNDHFYSHAKDQQQQALDEESQAYEESMNNYIKGLRNTLDEAQLNMTLFMEQVTSMVMLNAGIIEQEYHDTGLAISQDLTTPWANAKNAMAQYEVDGIAMMNAWISKGGFFDNFNTQATADLKTPWTVGQTAIGAFETSVSTAMSNVVADIKSNVVTGKAKLAELQAEIDKINSTTVRPKVVTDITGSNGTGSNGTGGDGNNNDDDTKKQTSYTVTATVKVGGIKTLTATMESTTEAKAREYAEAALATKFRDYRIKEQDDSPEFAEKIWLSNYSKKVKYATVANTFAKGTTGTTKDQWAVTDEPWFGDELVLVPGKDGNLSYVRKGTGIVPADATKELMKLADIGVDGLMMPKFNSGINMMSNYISKPELNISFGSMVHVDNCSQDTIKDLEKMVDTKINQFTRQLNYSLKKFTK
jgi:hypothetical protein